MAFTSLLARAPAVGGRTAALVAMILLVTSSCASAPTGKAGQEADALAKKMQVAVALDAWAATKVVRFSFRESRQWLWDRERAVVQLQDGDGSVWLDTWDHGGIVHDKDGAVVTGAEATERLTSVWSLFINDTFWLNPFAAFDNEGVARELTVVDGQQALVVRFASGGVTPGDTYLFFADAEGLPTSWRMWVQVLPVKGFETDFSDWQILKSGAKVATSHKGPMGANIGMAPAAGGASLADVDVETDVFAPLMKRRGL